MFQPNRFPLTLMAVWLFLFHMFSGVAEAQSLSRPDGTTLRIVNYNVFHTSVFPSDDGSPPPGNTNRIENFARLVKALDADIWGLQEVRYSPAQKAAVTEKGIVEHMQNLTGVTWYSSYAEPGLLILSKYPLIRADALHHRVQGVGIDLPESVSSRKLYYVNVHLAPASAEQQAIQADAAVNQLRKILSGSDPSIPANAAILVGGDFNSTVDSLAYRKMKSLDVGVPSTGAYEAKLFDPKPVQFGTQYRETFGSIDVSAAPPRMRGRLIDFVLYDPDRMPALVNKFILNTVIMDTSLLSKHGLRPEDVALHPDRPLTGTINLDHLPIVYDFGEKRTGSGSGE